MSSTPDPARRRLITIGVLTGMFLAALEATVVGTAMPTVVAALGGLAHFSWVFSAYLLTSTVTVPLWGKLSDLYGRRLLYQIGVAIFLAGSVMSGLAQSMFQLILWRTIQGVGAGALIPLGMTIVGEIYTLEERARMQGLFSGVWGLSSIVGPLIGGFLTDQLSWRWVFFINVPFGIASALIIGMSMHAQPVTSRPKIDYLGSIVLTVAVTLLMLVLVEGGSAAALMRPRNLALFAIVIAMLFWFVRIERKAAEPVVPLVLFRNRVVLLALIVGFLVGIAMFAAISFVPLFAQGAMGASATAAGTLLTPFMLAWVLSSIVAGRLMIKVGTRLLVIAGGVVLAAGFALLTLHTRAPSRLALIVDLSLIGIGMGISMLTLLIAVQHAVPRDQLGIATSLNQFFRTIGGAIGVALLGALLSAGLSAKLHEAALRPSAPLTTADAGRLAENPSALVSPEARSQVSPAILGILQHGLSESIFTVFAASTVVTILALIASFFFPPGRPTRQDEGERFVMAEMTVIDPEHEPEGT